jgi:hypothetical protein
MTESDEEIPFGQNPGRFLWQPVVAAWAAEKTGLPLAEGTRRIGAASYLKVVQAL